MFTTAFTAIVIMMISSIVMILPMMNEFLRVLKMWSSPL